jgi:hypothetical protein
MLDISYAGTPLVGEYRAPGLPPQAGPAPGDRYPDRLSLPGTRHHLIVSGRADDEELARLRRRWHDLVDVSQAPGEDPVAVLVRPDGYIGFRAAPADQAGLRALDTHLASYLVPA